MPSRDVSRRDFTRAAVAAAVVPVLGPVACAPAPAPAPPPAPDAAPPTSAENDPVVEGLMDVIRGQYGERLTAEEAAKVERGVRGMLRTAQRLREFPLPISAEPAFVYRVPGGPPR